jgi:tripartite-type tricarboxylate transporter receptor subunit TctC
MKSAVSVAAGIAVLSASALAQPVEEPFFKGKTITIAVGAPPGGTLDPYARLMQKFLGARIPGSPNIVVTNVPGASSNVLARQISAAAPKDGTMIGAVFHGVAVEPLIGQGDQRGFDPGKFSWLGSSHPEIAACAVRADLNVKAPADFLTQEVVLGSTSPGSPPFDFPTIANRILGTKFKMVTGYGGGQAMMLALERREVDGLCIAWSTVKTHLPDILRGKAHARVIAQSEMEGTPEFIEAGVPTLASLAKTQEDREALAFFFGPNAFGGPFILPPGVPQERVALLRKAFNEVFADKEAAAEAQRLNIDWAPLSGEEVQKRVETIYAAAPQVIARVKAALAPPK